MSTIRDQLLSEIEAFLAGSGMSPTDFGLQVCNDGSFVARLRNGTDPRGATVDRCRAFITRYRADDGAPRSRPRRAQASVSAAA